MVCEELPAVLNPATAYVLVADSAEALGHMAAAFHGHPSRQLQLVGVTGTNGKTTCATLLHKLLRELGYHAGLLSTVQNQIDEEVIPSTHTTPDAIRLNALLARMVAAGCTHACMEVSSHAVAQHRITGLRFAGGVFTNLTHDHLDYHGTFDNYLKAKKGLFRRAAQNRLRPHQRRRQARPGDAAKHRRPPRHLLAARGRHVPRQAGGQ